MTARRWHTLGAALASALVLVAVIAGAWLTAGPSGALPTGSRDLPASATGAVAPDGAREPDPAGAAPTAQLPAVPPATAGVARAPASASYSGTAPWASPNAAARLRTLPSGTRQVIVVSSDRFDSTTATLEAFAKVNGAWLPAFAAMPARIGSRGFADSKVEGDLRTPTGVYPVGDTMYGIAADPGVRYGYHRLVADDWWNENPASPGYNSFYHGSNPGGASEALWQISPQYRYFAVINYNIPVVPADPPRGSGIFLHVENPGRATAGCVSLSEANLLAILRWLDPAAAPRIVMAPRGVLGRY